MTWGGGTSSPRLGREQPAQPRRRALWTLWIQTPAVLAVSGFHTLLPASGPCPSPGDALPDFWTPWHRRNFSSQLKCTASLPRSKPWRQLHGVLQPPVRTQSVCAMVWLTPVSPCTWGVASGGRDRVCSGPQHRAWHVASQSKSLFRVLGC